MGGLRGYPYSDFERKLGPLVLDRNQKDIFRLVDIICCGAILIPIIWSIKHLREASKSDGKGNKIAEAQFATFL